MGLKFCFVIFAILPLALRGQADKIRTLDNGHVALRVSLNGGAFVSFTLRSSEAETNPLSSVHGHFVCVDGFGPVSDHERSAGRKSHGEAHYQVWGANPPSISGGIETLEVSAHLPLANQRFSRRLRLAAGEQVVYVSSTLENLSPVDRPVMWQEHATIGSPFLEPGATVIDMPAEESATRPLRIGAGPLGNYGTAGPRFQSGTQFEWPWAPGAAGDRIDLRTTPSARGSISITAHRLRREKLAFVTALNLRTLLLIGYVFRTSDFPWVQNWESYEAGGLLHRGLEFGFSPFGMPKIEAVKMGQMFGTPVYRWLPAMGRIDASYLMFLAQAAEGMRGVDTVELADGFLTLNDLKAGRTLRLKASLGLP